MTFPHCVMCPDGHFRFSTKDGVCSEQCDSCGFSRRVTPVARPPYIGRVEVVCDCGARFSYDREWYFKKDGEPKKGRTPPSKCPLCARSHAGRIGGKANVAALRGVAA